MKTVNPVDSAVSIVTRLWAVWPRSRGSVPAGGRRPALGPIQPPIHWVLGTVSLGSKQQGDEADHSPPSSVQLKNGGTILPLPHTSSWLGA
jgi:hypothetical protein